MSPYTTKLYFNKYVHRIVITTPLAGWFRTSQDIPAHKKWKGLERAIVKWRETLVSNPSILINSWTHKYASAEHVDLVEDLLAFFKLSFPLSLHVTSDCLYIYFNDIKIKSMLLDKFSKHIIEANSPKNETIEHYLLNHKDKILVNELPEYKYRVTVRELGDQRDEFMSWAIKMPGVHVAGFPKLNAAATVYVSDDKVLQLCRLFIGNKIRRIEEFVYINDI